MPLCAAQNKDGDWPMAARDYATTRYSPLNQINTSSVHDLKPAFAFSTGLVRGHEAAPIVVGNTMYIVTPYPHYLYALDLTQPVAPMKWRFDPKPDASAQGVACCDVVNRGAAYADGKIFFNTLDDQTIAVDAQSAQGSLARQARRYQPGRNHDHDHDQDHGGTGGGDSGPPPMDDKWIYGHEPADIFASIMQGWPNGMPSFGGHIAEEQAWQIVAYIRSMSGQLRSDVAPSRGDSLFVLIVADYRTDRALMRLPLKVAKS